MAYALEDQYRQEFSKQHTIAGVATLLADSARQLGWDLAAFSVERETNLPRQKDGSLISTAMGWPLECVSAWTDRRMALSCPVTQRCGRVTDSFAWHCSTDDPLWSKAKLTAEQCEVLDHLGQYVAGATTVPVHRPGGKIGYVSWFLRDGSKLDELHCGTYHATYLLSHIFIRRVDEISASHRRSYLGGEEVTLTPREIECLTWAANGKTEEEIGIIIERSHETARFHLRNAIQKLNAANRTHAVAIACSRGMITVR